MGKSNLFLLIILAIFIIPGCQKSSSSSSNSTGTQSVLISWTANKESGVNQAGGGYKVYYSTTSDVDTSSATVVDVPWISGSTAPVSTTLNLASGTYYLKVAAYSALNSAGSSLSEETTVIVP